MSNLENKIKKLTVFGATIGLMFLINCSNKTSNQTTPNNQINRTERKIENTNSEEIPPEVLSGARRDINIGMDLYRGSAGEYVSVGTGNVYDDEGRAYSWYLSGWGGSNINDSTFEYTLIITNKRTEVKKKYIITINRNQKLVTDLRSR